MNEEEQPPVGNEEEQRLRRYTSLAETLSQRPEGFPFPGIDEDSHRTLQAVDEEYAGYVTPINQVIVQMEEQGIKVVLGVDPKSGNIYILPLLSDDIGDSVLPRHLKIIPGMDKSLKELVVINRALASGSGQT